MLFEPVHYVFKNISEYTKTLIKTIGYNSMTSINECPVNVKKIFMYLIFKCFFNLVNMPYSILPVQSVELHNLKLACSGTNVKLRTKCKINLFKV